MDIKALLDSLDLGVVVIAPDWTIAQWSAAASRITGLPADRVLGRNFWVAFPTAKGTHIEQALHEVLANGQPQTVLAPVWAVPRAPGAARGSARLPRARTRDLRFAGRSRRTRPRGRRAAEGLGVTGPAD